MFGLFRSRVPELSPAEVEAGLEAGTILLVDVREPHEFAAEHIRGAVLAPLSRFEAAALKPGKRSIVLHCGVGQRSAVAAARCAKAGVAIAGHLKGGISAWKRAGFPTVSGPAR
jgi:rhodanese-related sulfurtransferase